MRRKKDEKAEFLIKLLVRILHYYGYRAVRLSQTKNHFTTAYDGIAIMDLNKHAIFHITIENENTDDLKDIFFGGKEK